MLSTNELEVLAKIIKRNIEKNFAYIHLSKNLIDTIVVRQTSMGFEVDIPAEIYDISKWYKDKVVVYTGKGSYAQAVDDKGGFSGYHTNYVENAIKDAIDEWNSIYSHKVRRIEWL